MIQNKFIWADLSNYEPQEVRPFYETIFNWSYYDTYGYLTAYLGNTPISGLYQTPEKFQKMKMPAFWMSYIQVKNVQDTVERAESLGGIIELVDVDNPIGAVALIRDTQGAGFTIYEGAYLDARTVAQENTLIFNELHVSDAQKAVEFYQNLFDWKCEWIDETSVEVSCNSSKEVLARIHQMDNFFKGKYQYWVCTFGIKNLQDALTKVKQFGGTIISDEGNRVMCSDGTEAFFYLQEI